MATSETDRSGRPGVPLPAWAHGCGMLALGEAAHPADAAAAADRHLIIERISRYCWGYDERQLDRLLACFTEDGVWEGNVLGRIPIGPFKGREKIGTWLSGFWPYQHDQRRHMILNTLVEEQTRTTATTWSYLLLMSSDGKHAKIETTGFYKVRTRLEGGQWLIENLTAGFDAPFWPGEADKMSARGRARHGIDSE